MEWKNIEAYIENNQAGTTHTAAPVNGIYVFPFFGFVSAK